MQRNGILLITLLAMGAALTTPAHAQCLANNFMNKNKPVANHALPSQLLAGTRFARPEMKREDAPGNPGQGNPANATIVGLWQVAFISDGQIADQGFDVWHADGTELLNDTPPPASGNICVGVWQETALLTFKLNHPSWTFDPNGNLNGTAVIRETITLDKGGNKYSGIYTVTVYDLNSNIIFSQTGTVTGERITVD